MTILFSFPDSEHLSHSLLKQPEYQKGEFVIHHFPDGETLVRLHSDVNGKDVDVLCSLDRPDSKIIPLIFFAKTARSYGAKSIRLIAPYLGYMRQDKIFNDGEGVTSKFFADILSSNFDRLLTIDPHLHRYRDMSELYKIPVTVKHATDPIAAWVKENISRPLFIGPDEESKQWVSDLAEKIGASYLVLNKTRRGDAEVEVSVPQIELYKNHTMVLVDDIISTANTMIQTVNHLKSNNVKSILCIGVHAIFAGAAYENLKNSGVDQVVTCNTIYHPSNQIDVSGLLKFF